MSEITSTDFNPSVVLPGDTIDRENMDRIIDSIYGPGSSTSHLRSRHTMRIRHQIEVDLATRGIITSVIGDYAGGAIVLDPDTTQNTAYAEKVFETARAGMEKSIDIGRRTNADALSPEDLEAHRASHVYRASVVAMLVESKEREDKRRKLMGFEPLPEIDAAPEGGE